MWKKHASMRQNLAFKATDFITRAIGGAGTYRWPFGSAQMCSCTTLSFAKSFQIDFVQVCFQILQFAFLPHQFAYFSWFRTTRWSRIIVVTFFRWQEVDGNWRTDNFSCLVFVVVRQDGLLWTWKASWSFVNDINKTKVSKIVFGYHQWNLVVIIYIGTSLLLRLLFLFFKFWVLYKTKWIYENW